MEADMSRPLFAVTAISAFWLSYLSTSLVYGSGGTGYENLGERAAIIENAGERQYPTSWENQHKHGWKKYGCFDEMIKDLLLTPMWCKGAWGDPLYPFPSEGEKSERNVSRTADVALRWSR